MIEFVENKEATNRKSRFLLLINKKIVSAKIRNFNRDEKVFININANDLEATETISQFKFQNYPNLYYLTMPISYQKAKLLERIYITYNHATKKYEVKFRYSSAIEIWKRRTNYLRFYRAYSRYIAELNYPESKITKKIEQLNLKPEINSLSHKSGFKVSFTVINLDSKLSDEIEYYSSILTGYHTEALKNINSTNNYEETHEISNTIENTFNFPEELRIPSEQYLIYFAKFLKDLGINATQNLKEEAGKVLFSVTPTDDIEALDRIREALAVYLNLPSSPIAYDDSFAAIRLQQQIENFEHSQRMAVREIQLAEKVIIIQSETIQDKNTIISQKDSTIEQQSKIIEKISSKSIMMDSVENKDELEEIFDGLKIGESKFLKEQTGMHFNLATFAKGIGKSLIGKEGEITSLNLDEETNQENS